MVSRREQSTRRTSEVSSSDQIVHGIQAVSDGAKVFQRVTQPLL
jgi:hypothetical protein